jgi:hypothetical protein
MVLVASIVVGFNCWGIWGTGVAIVVAHVAEWLIVWGYAYWQYQYRCTWAIARYVAVQLTVGLLAFAVSLASDGLNYWIAEAALVLASTAYSLYILRQKTHLWQKLCQRFRI